MILNVQFTMYNEELIFSFSVSQLFKFKKNSLSLLYKKIMTISFKDEIILLSLHPDFGV